MRSPVLMSNGNDLQAEIAYLRQEMEAMKKKLQSQEEKEAEKEKFTIAVLGDLHFGKLDF